MCVCVCVCVGFMVRSQELWGNGPSDRRQGMLHVGRFLEEANLLMTCRAASSGVVDHWPSGRT